MKLNVLVFFVVFLILFGACSKSLDVKEESVVVVEEKKDLIKIVAFGDSLTEGLYEKREDAYPAQLERKLLDEGYDVEVVNSGISGETSSSALARAEWIYNLKPDIVILETGPNDGLRGIDLSLTYENIEKIVDFYLERNVSVVLCGMIMTQNLGEKYVNEFESMYPKIAEDKEVYFVPNFLDGVYGNSSLNNEDEIHPNKEGYTIIVEKNVYPVVKMVLDEKFE